MTMGRGDLTTAEWVRPKPRLPKLDSGTDVGPVTVVSTGLWLRP